MAKKKQPKKKERNQSTRTSFKFNSKAQDTLKSLFELPVDSSFLDSDAIDKINRDSAVIAAMGRRKATTLKKEINITCEDDTIRTNLEECFDYDTLDSMLDIPYQGFGVFEIVWKLKDNLYYPSFTERAVENFKLKEGVLKFTPNGIEQDIPIHKAIYGLYKAKPNKPYGQALYNPLYWLIEFKNASLEFWIELLERFGTPWVIAKTEGEKDALADEIYNMLGGDGAVIDTDDSIEIKTADKVGNFKEIIEYIDDQIRELITGGNLTGNVKGGSQAAATVHNDIREDIAKADENILNKMFAQAVKLFKEGNYLNIDIQARLKDKDDPNKALADRDKVIFDMGYRPTKEYIEKTFGLEVEEIADNSNTKEFKNNMMKFSKELPQDELEFQSNSIETINPLTFQKQIIKILENCKSYEDMNEQLLEVYPNLDMQDLQDNLAKYLANSDILARAEIEEEHPNG